jgi:hypothetical protein
LGGDRGVVCANIRREADRREAGKAWVLGIPGFQPHSHRWVTLHMVPTTQRGFRES